ncbi:MAG: hypothetical protein J6T68_01985 [Candidatus Methanomethylophilaceae archaeon]|nr:hypothetical protein [Candidatus Methanomethylophilaceae archaeon]
MIVNTPELISQLEKDYSNPKCKIGRMVKEGKYIPIIRGLYETDPDTEGYLLADTIYGPSYLSFEYALARHGLIGMREGLYTSATVNKHRTKSYETPFGTFTYRDVPARVFGLEVDMENVGDYSYSIARPEKALCDMLYTLPPAADAEELKSMMFRRIGIDMHDVYNMDASTVCDLSEGYRCRNVNLLYKLMCQH